MTSDNPSPTDHASSAVLEPPAELTSSYRMATEPPKEPQEPKQTDGTAPGSHAGKRRGGFAPGNQLWRKRESTLVRNVSRSRREVREALLSELTPEKMAKAVRQ